MSIPPLVCSTPPPPEQCEDDKDQEDFDINYHLSQEDDEGIDYDYGNFSSFNNFKSTTSEPCQPGETTQDDRKYSSNNIIEADIKNTKTEDKITGEPLEDDILEDLNLKIDQDNAVNLPKNINEESEASTKDKAKNLQKDLEIDIPVNSDLCQQAFEVKKDDKIFNIEGSEESQADSDEKSQSLSSEVIGKESDDCMDSQNCDIDTVKDINSNSSDNVEEPVNDTHKYHVEENTIEKSIDDSNLDEFEDFDDFQFVSSDNKSSEIVIDTASQNPWQDDVANNEGFGDFTANFGDSENNAVLEQNTDGFVQKHNNSEDDFGDFDEFKSVSQSEPNKAPPETCEEVSVLNFHSSDSEHQIIERINTVIHTIFQNEIEESSDMIESNLETSLGETWSYLRETDVRQPYIVHWNTSLAQKSLLKALCIDSRNILYGPKWSSSTPKYAAALTTAPLQPQKQMGQSSASPSEVNHTDKSMNKPWSDPFTADGQESCHTERDNTIMETGPTDLDVFEAAIQSTKPEKIYSNTINIQPMRQINLPDTHIFTPTNSEIPRSKTIHYDNTPAPSVLLPQSTSENTSTTQSLDPQSENDYWEFQDFRGGTSESKVLGSTSIDDSTERKDTAHPPNVTLATQVLQPIKLEPTIPTLNWPDPGEVIETFDDFSDFISNIPAGNETSMTPQNKSTNVLFVDKKDLNKIEINSNSYDKDDEFEVFQSALPSSFKSNTKNCDFKKTDSECTKQASSSQVSPQPKMTDFDVVFSKSDNVKSNNISQATTPIENIVKNVSNAPIILNSPPAPPSASQMLNSDVLQPSLATSSVPKPSQQKVSQILQPLSLESYSQINWPNPGIDLQDLSRFNPVESLHSLKNDSNSQSKTASPVHNHKGLTNNNQTSDEDIWGEFVSSKPKQQQQTIPKKQATFADDEEWTDFVSSPSVPHNGLNTISLNVHTSSSMQKTNNSTQYQLKSNEISLDIPALNYITPKNNKSYNDRHFQNL